MNDSSDGLTLHLCTHIFIVERILLFACQTRPRHLGVVVVVVVAVVAVVVVGMAVTSLVVMK